MPPPPAPPTTTAILVSRWLGISFKKDVSGQRTKSQDNLNESFISYSVIDIFLSFKRGWSLRVWRLKWKLLSVWPFKWKLLSSTLLWYCLLCSTRWFSFSSVLQKQILSLFGVHGIVFVRRKEWKIYQWLNNNQTPERNEQSYLGRGHFPLSFSSSTYFTNTSLHRLRRTSRANSATLPSDWSAWRSTSGVPFTNENWRRVSKQDLANSSRRGNPFASVPVWRWWNIRL